MSSGQKEARRVRARPAQLGFDGVELTCSTKQAGLTSDKVGYLNQSSETNKTERAKFSFTRSQTRLGACQAELD